MKLSKLFVIALLAGTSGLIGCSDDPPPTGNGGSGGTAGAGGTGGVGGTAGTGGSAGTGGAAGTGGVGGGIDVSCDEGRCVDPPQATKCQEAILACIAAEPANEEQCIALGNFIYCDEVAVVRVFVTDIIFNGNLGGLAGADTKCTDAATAANPPLSRTWTAWLSGEGTDAIDRIAEGQYRLLDGTVLANNKANLTDGDIDAPINLNENLVTEPGGNVWTATGVDGTNPGVGDCQDWLTDDPGQSGRPGRLSEVDARWTDIGGGNTCDKNLHLYCFADATSN